MAAIDMDKLKQSGQRFLTGFTTGQKFVTAIALTFLLIGGYFFSQWESAPTMAALYTDLDSSDASKVAQELDSAGVRYELADGGRTIRVARDDIYKTRIDLSAKGLPSGGDSFALLDQGGITQSEFSQRIDYQRALQGELSNTIMAIDGVDGATVNLTLPRDEIFVDADSPQSTAAVLVRTASGIDLSTEQVQSMVHLVSSSVPDLRPENITVTNQNGDLLKPLGEKDVGGAGSRQSEQRIAYEAGISGTIEAMLTRTLGTNKAVVGVNVEMDFSEQTKETRQLTPSGKGGKNLAVSETTKDENFTGSNASDAGALGPTGEPLGTNSAGDKYKLSQADRTFAPNETNTTETVPAGRVVRKSVAVQIDESAIAATDLPAFTRSISAAAGIDERGRGDIIDVSLVKMAAVADPTEALTKALKPADNSMAGAIRYGATLLIIALVLFFAWRGVKKSQIALHPVRVPIDLNEIEAAERSAAGALKSGESEAPRDLELTGSAERLAALEPALSPLQREITDLIENQPEDVAQTLRSWLADRRT